MLPVDFADSASRCPNCARTTCSFVDVQGSHIPGVLAKPKDVENVDLYGLLGRPNFKAYTLVEQHGVPWRKVVEV